MISSYLIVLYFHVKELIMIGWQTFDKNQYHPLKQEARPNTCAAFNKASTRERSPTKQYLWRNFLLFSRRTFAGACFTERSTDGTWQRVILLDDGRYSKNFRRRKIYARTVHRIFWLASYERLNIGSTKYKH